MGHVSYEFHRELFQKNRHHLLVYREPHWPAQIAAVPVLDTAVLQKDEKKTNVDFHIKKNLLFLLCSILNHCIQTQQKNVYIQCR